MPLFRARQTFDDIVSKGGAPLGAFITSTDPNSTLAAAAGGCDFVVIDGEHGPLDVAHQAQHVVAAKALSVIPLVRVLEDNPVQIQRSLDFGAGGVIVPKVSTGEQAARAVKAATYAPGGRGMCQAVRGALWDMSNWDTHASDSNSNTLVIPLIETREGIRNAKEIAAVEGIGYVYFGPADLAQDIGSDMMADGDTLIEMWAQFIDDVHAGGARAGAPFGYGFAGADFGTAGSDIMSWRETCAANVTRYRHRASD